jgi:hypothetical protein
VHPAKHSLLLKFIKSKITGEAKDRLLSRSGRNIWEQVKAILEENYAVERTLIYLFIYLFMQAYCSQPNKVTMKQWPSGVKD